jgi:hypothetical protein
MFAKEVKTISLFSTNIDPTFDMHATRFHPVRMAAISINNIAAALLCKGSIQEGMEMLTNAVKLMKFVSEEPSTENDADWAEDLRQAQKYSSKSMHCDEQSMSFHIKTIYSQAPAYSLSQSSEFFDRVPMPIYIEQITMEEGDGKAVLLFECAIVLYNLGLSHSLLAQKSATATCSLQNAMRESSLHVMELAEKSPHQNV